MLKYKLDQEGFAAQSEDMQKLYSEKDGDYFLQVEGATSKTKVDEFRTSNIDLENKLKKFDGVDMDKYQSMLETDRKMRNKELIEKGDFDTLLAEHTQALRSDHDGKVENLTTQLAASAASTKGLISKYEIEGAAHKAFAAHKIQPAAHDAVMAQIKSKFTINEGKVVAMEGENIVTGADGNLTVSEFVQSQPEFMKVPSSGGGGQGSESTTPAANNGAKRAAFEKLVAKK